MSRDVQPGWSDGLPPSLTTFIATMAPFVTAPFVAPLAKSAVGRPSIGARIHVVPTCTGAGPAPGAAGNASCHTANPSGANATPFATSGRDAWSGVAWL